MTIISDTAALTALCDRLSAEKFITVDTEFMRDKTYWPILCLVQVAGSAESLDRGEWPAACRARNRTLQHRLDTRTRRS